ncbi:MAG: M67 family metallopeptidase [Campylobacteraceae bacterium]|jgi:proteasome lid subunit RPN8/RPN11|nr:M67 family metallopeptidase [Campylobacteraceae bacterium]
MIKIPENIYEAIIKHAQSKAPIEACGYLAGINGEVKAIYEMTNADNSEEHFSFDPEEQFAALKSAGKAGLRLIACYHSHPATPARPSQEDIRLAYDPNISYIIVSLAQDKPVLKSFKIKNKEAANEEVEVLS